MKLALGIEYDGSAYYGWQCQNNFPSIQSYLEQALSKIANESITVVCAGRTDAGVHAIEQVVHFETNASRPNTAWTIGVNSYLPTDITVTWSTPVREDFHARFSAKSRHYRYVIYNHQIRSSLLQYRICHIRKTLDADRMQRAGQHLIGEHDFSSFCASKNTSQHCFRHLHYLQVTRKNRYLIVDIQANAFIYNMVRIIVGSLVEVGYGNRPEHWIAELLNIRDRNFAGRTAKAEGLYLVRVDYPSYFALPSSKH